MDLLHILCNSSILVSYPGAYMCISIYLIIINGQSVYSTYSFDAANSSEKFVLLLKSCRLFIV